MFLAYVLYLSHILYMSSTTVWPMFLIYVFYTVLPEIEHVVILKFFLMSMQLRVHAGYLHLCRTECNVLVQF